jgi:methanogenic corrinoid protein MtbC1
MVEALLALEGADCVPLGTQMPLLEICRAADAHRADIVALSFSVAFPQRQIPGLLQQLRQMLPAGVALWAGGRGVTRTPRLEGVQLLVSLDAATAAIAAWRAARAPAT